MLSSLFTRRPDVVQDPALVWTPLGTTVVQRYRNTLGPLEGVIVLVYTSASDCSSSYAAACLSCTYRAARNDRRVRLGETEAADLANAHAAHCRAINRGLPAIPDAAAAVQIVRSRLQSMRPYGVSLHPVHLTDFLKAAPAYSGSTGIRFLVQPPPPRK